MDTISECHARGVAHRDINDKNILKNSAKRDTQPLKGHDLTHKCSLRGIPKDYKVEKILECLEKKTWVGGQIFLRGRG